MSALFADSRRRQRMQKKFTAEEILAALNQYYKESIFITDGEGNIIFVN